MNSTEISNLIKKELTPRKTVLVHGTSVESIFNLFRTGRYRNKALRKEINKVKYVTFPEHMFFAPVGRYFKNHKILRKHLALSRCTLKESKEYCESYAHFNAVDHFAFVKLGFLPNNISEIAPYSKKMVKHYFIPDLEKKGYKTEVIENFIRDAKKRKGVLLGINENILEFRVLKGKEVPNEEVCIHLPDGLDKKYINSIVPLGNIEKRLIKRYIKQISA